MILILGMFDFTRTVQRRGHTQEYNYATGEMRVIFQTSYRSVTLNPAADH